MGNGLLKISIVTVSYNAEDTITDTIKSVLSQSYSNIEYIIVDGGSSDGTVAIIEQYAEYIHAWVSEPDQGIYDAMNKGIAMATGDVVGILNADDIYAHVDALQKVVEVFEDTSIDCCYGDLVYVSEDLSKHVRYWKSSAYDASLFAKAWIPPHPTFFVRKEGYARCGKFDTQYKLAADYELMLRFLWKFKLRATYISDTLIKMRLGGATNNSIRNIIRGNMEIYKAAKSHGLAIGSGFLFSKIVNRLSQFIKA